MSVFALVNAFAYVHGYDFSTDINKLQLSVTAEQLDSTVFTTTGYKSLIGGLKNWDFSMSGFWQSATAQAVDVEAFPELGTGGRVYTCGADQTDGSPCFMGQGGKFGYQMLGTVGEITPFSLNCYNTDKYGIVRGYLGKAKGTVSATGALGVGTQIGAVGANEFLYGTFHITGTPGTTITAVLESDDNAGFSSPTTRATVGPLTTAGGTWVTRVAGPITDDYVRWRVTAITGTFTVAAAYGKAA